MYAKGHLRKYAALLGLPVAELVAGYESLHLGAQQPQATSVRSLVPNSVLQNLPWGKIAGGAAVLAVLIGVAWWQSSQQRQAATIAAAAAAKQAVEAPAPDTVPLPEPAPPSSAATATAPVTPSSAPLNAAAAPPAPAPAAVPAPAPESGTGRARLRMSFSADSWVDVRDAKGKRVFAGNGRANSVKIARRRGAVARLSGIRERRAARNQRARGGDRAAVRQWRRGALRSRRRRRPAP